MKKIIGLIVFVILVGGGYYTWQEMQKTETTDDAEIDGDVIAISARVPGHVTEVMVEDNQTVNKGDVLVTAATTGSALNGAKSSRQEAAEAITWAEQQRNVSQARLSLAQANVK